MAFIQRARATVIFIMEFFGNTYSRLPNSSSHDDLSENGHRLDHTNPQTLPSRRIRWFQMFIGLAILLSGILIGRFSQPPMVEPRTSAQQSQYEAPHSFAPSISEKTIVFTPTAELMAAPNSSNQRYWDSLTPIGRGFVNVSDPQRYNLQPGIPTASGIERFSVAMFHQLHCLALLRKHYFTLLNAMGGEWTQEERDAERRRQLADRHAQHCIAYLAQSILCSADLTLEWAHVERDGSRRQVFGWGVPHQCKDPSAVWDWVVRNHGPG